MARKRKRSKKRSVGSILGYAGAAAGLGSRYIHAKRAYHQLGDALYRAKHHGKSIKSAGRRRKRTKHRQSR